MLVQIGMILFAVAAVLMSGSFTELRRRHHKRTGYKTNMVDVFYETSRFDEDERVLHKAFLYCFRTAVLSAGSVIIFTLAR